MSNFTAVAKEDGYETPKFKIWSNLQFVALQQRLNAPINMKFGMKEHNRGLLLHAKFALDRRKR